MVYVHPYIVQGDPSNSNFKYLIILPKWRNVISAMHQKSLRLFIIGTRTQTFVAMKICYGLKIKVMI